MSTPLLRIFIAEITRGSFFVFKIISIRFYCWFTIFACFKFNLALINWVDVGVDLKKKSLIYYVSCVCVAQTNCCKRSLILLKGWIITQGKPWPVCLVNGHVLLWGMFFFLSFFIFIYSDFFTLLSSPSIALKVVLCCWTNLIFLLFKDITSKWAEVRLLVPQRDGTLEAVPAS